MQSLNLFSLKSAFVCDEIIAVINWINKVAAINSIVFVLGVLRECCLFWLVGSTFVRQQNWSAISSRF